jgi:hypothetical protein
MTEREAEEVLQGAELHVVFHASMVDVKRLRSQCLEADIPAVMACPPKSGKS